MKLKLTKGVNILLPAGTILECDDVTLPAFGFPKSFWSKKLSTEAIHPSSASLVAELAKNAVGKPGYWGDPWINADDKAVAVYTVTTNIPKVPVRLVKRDGTPDLGRPLLSARLAQGVRIPANAVVANASDQQFASYDAIDDQYFELWRGKKTAAGWDCVNAGLIEKASLSDGTVPQINGEWNGATATHIPCGAGLITLADLKSGVIPHVLAFAMPFANNKFVWPASASDGNNKTVGQPLYMNPDGSPGPIAPWTPTIPEGMRFRLPASYVVDPTLPPLARMILTAIRDYGQVLVDYAGSYVYATENAAQYGVTDILGPYMAGKHLWDIMPMIPVSSMLALA